MSTNSFQNQRNLDGEATSVVLVCPTCRGTLDLQNCRQCGANYREMAGVPVLLPRSGQYAAEAATISARYDTIYTAHSNVWEDQGRQANFRRYFAGLAAQLGRGTLLEIGSGEGLLLEAFESREKYAVDISANALAKARVRTGAVCAAAIGENLPFPDESFDVVTSVGVMEHFIDAERASQEIRRVLRPGGSYLMLIHVAMTAGQRLRQKVNEFVFPLPHPVKLMQWVKKKLFNRIHQPIRNIYTIDTCKAVLERNGLKVTRIITLRSDPKAPLAGEHVVVYVAERASEQLNSR